MSPRQPSDVTSSPSPTGIGRPPSAADRSGSESAAAVATTSPVACGLSEPLSAREFEVLWLLRDGLSYQEIGRKLSISERTARAHVAAIKEKLGAATAAHCVARGFERKLLK